jgi:hypothetical protein
MPLFLRNILAISSAIKMEAICSSAMLAYSHNITQHKNVGDNYLYLQHHDNLKSYTKLVRGLPDGMVNTYHLQ